MAQFIPAVLEETAEDTIALLAKLALKAHRAHVDIADETLVPNLTALPSQLLDLTTPLKLDAHLMVDQPVAYYRGLAHIGFQRVIIHCESVQPTQEAITEAAAFGFRVGVALNPDTAIERIDSFVGQIEFVMIMGVEPGFMGGEFQPSTFDRIRQVKNLYPQLPVAVDGGVRLYNAADLLEAGADYLISSRQGYEVDGSITAGLERWKELIRHQSLRPFETLVRW